MITPSGYSKDQSIKPEAIAVTFGKELIEAQGGLLKFLRRFNECVEDEENYWMHKCKNKPQHEVNFVYIIVCNRILYKVLYGGYVPVGNHICVDANEQVKEVSWAHIILAGPIERAPEKIIRKGFQGFRYTTMLF